ncbi:PDR/VanB family oxidoreductase [Microbacterium halophytorum]|uniref:PDR/VanB family oxidoreductase n=1 Tax=Microbacterium halophytorum TaxID=2067568 RepID=UPI0018E0B77B|nr:PDR/VanB family oxidoreductase [Microbacterium halophytorum]
MTMTMHAPARGAVLDTTTLTVTAITRVADDVVAVELARPDGSRLPDWAPGAHIDIELPGGKRRQYSLCGDRWNAHAYRVAVKREPDGRGGSAYVHDSLAVGDAVGFGGPRNNFRLAPADEYLFVAGGIGITPILPMLAQAEVVGAPWRLLYLVRDASSALDLGRWNGHPSITFHDASALGRCDLDGWRPTDPGVRVWACGPERLLDAVEAWPTPEGGVAPKTERFTASAAVDAVSRPFEVVARRSGRATRVEAGGTIAESLRRAGIDVITSCGQGLCGTCETDVIAGTPDHRDALLDDAERAEGRVIFPCVSRCIGDRIVLDI